MGVVHLKFARRLLPSLSIINSLLIFTAALGTLPLDLAIISRFIIAVLLILVGKFLKVIEISKSLSSLSLEIGAVTSQLEK
jgi:hypothetical protein